MANPKITVLMSVYNGEKYLREAIDGILSQTFKDFEFIIINDASTDASKDIILSYDDHRIKLIDNEENIGLTKSLNKGLELAKGEYIARQDADDVSDPRRFEKQIKFLDRNSDYAVVGTFVRIIDEYSKIIQEPNSLITHDEIIKALNTDNAIAHGSVMMRMSYLREIGFYDESMMRSQDYDLWLRLSEKYKLANIPEHLFSWRRHEEQIEATHKAEQKAYVEIAKDKTIGREAKTLGPRDNTQHNQHTLDLAIYILFYEKIDQTIKCVKSFLPSGVKIYVLNNASSTSSRDILGKYCKRYDQVTIFDSDVNLGVSKGRNFLIDNTTEEWLFFVDNDIYVKIKNWLRIMKTHIHENPEVEVFIMRLYNLQNKNYGSYKRIEISDNNARFVVINDDQISNCFPGGASIINRRVFNKFGLYDEQMFVGLEDYELCIRGILSGEPVRAKIINDIELIHDHKQMKKEKDKNALKVRYDVSHIENSYNRIIKKHNVDLEGNWILCSVLASEEMLKGRYRYSRMKSKLKRLLPLGLKKMIKKILINIKK